MVYTIIGKLIVGGVILIIVSFIIFLLFSLVHRIISYYVTNAHKEARIRVGTEFMFVADWFSEDKRTYHLLKNMGERIVQGYTIDAGLERDKWRKNYN